MIKNAFQLSAQHYRTPSSSMMKKTYHYPFAALNVKRRSEPVATDVIYCDTPVTCDCSTCDKLFMGTNTLMADVCGIESDKQFVSSLEYNISQRRAMDKLTPDSSKSEISTRVKDVLRALFIDYWQS